MSKDVASQSGDELNSLQIWGGIECTINRVSTDYKDQLFLNGHYHRDADLELIASLGIKALRYPVLWERYESLCAESPRAKELSERRRLHASPQVLSELLAEPTFWRWTQQRLTRLRSLGIQPIVGLLHHGSGPLETSLIDEGFPAGLEAYARLVAERHPDIEYFTPVNEPLTTARFSCLYGHWYPHATDNRMFMRALLQQCKATVQSMRAIREVNPSAKLVQTENLDESHSTPHLAHQAIFENHRRWLSMDLLSGRVDRQHTMWNHLRESGATERELLELVDCPCPPDIMGWNYYLTGERFLDERLELYPHWSHGGNGRERYADVEAVRVREEGLVGLGGLLHQAWERYGRPMAVTEVHLGCHRESQMRWFLDAWKTAQRVRSEGVDLRAITCWSLLGTYDWNSLCTRSDGFYEAGPFDVRTGVPRPTALARLVQRLAQGGLADHPALPEKGWWDHERRLIYTPVSCPREARASHRAELADFANADEAQLHTGALYRGEVRRKRDKSFGKSVDEAVEAAYQTGTQPAGAKRRPPVLIIGASGTLAKAFSYACLLRDLKHVTLSRHDLDVTQPLTIETAIEQYRPWAVINAAGYARVDSAENNELVCRAINTEGAANVARACESAEVQLLTFSSDLVFSGDRDDPYLERDRPSASCVYGQTKADAEELVLSICSKALVVRTSVFFGPWDESNFLTVSLRRLAAGEVVRAAEDWTVSPTYVPDLTHACLDLLVDGESGLWHLANSGAVCWLEFLQAAARETGVSDRSLAGCTVSEMGYVAPRPQFSVLGSERGCLLPSLGEGIRKYSAAWHEIRCR